MSAGCQQLFNRQLNGGFFLRREASLEGAWCSMVRKNKKFSEPVGRDGSQFNIL